VLQTKLEAIEVTQTESTRQIKALQQEIDPMKQKIRESDTENDTLKSALESTKKTQEEQAKMLKTVELEVATKVSEAALRTLLEQETMARNQAIHTLQVKLDSAKETQEEEAKIIVLAAKHTKSLQSQIDAAMRLFKFEFELTKKTQEEMKKSIVATAEVSTTLYDLRNKDAAVMDKTTERLKLELNSITEKLAILAQFCQSRESSSQNV